VVISFGTLEKTTLPFSRRIRDKGETLGFKSQVGKRGGEFTLLLREEKERQPNMIISYASPGEKKGRYTGG